MLLPDHFRADLGRQGGFYQSFVRADPTAEMQSSLLVTDVMCGGRMEDTWQATFTDVKQNTDRKINRHRCEHEIAERPDDVSSLERINPSPEQTRIWWEDLRQTHNRRL